MIGEFLKRSFIVFWEFFEILIIALLIVIPIRYFIFQAFVVKGSSMEPNFHNNDYLIVDELTYRLRPPERGEVIVFKYPNNPAQRFIKRVVGLPGEKVALRNGSVVIVDRNGRQFVLDESKYLPWPQKNSHTTDFIQLKKDEYFVLGDNRLHSFDSEEWGVLKREFIIGRAWFRAWPPTAMAFISTPSY